MGPDTYDFRNLAPSPFPDPMAISLGFGILFAAFITLLLVPALYLIIEDLRQLFRPREMVSIQHDVKMEQ
jgi:hypothetical protein